MTVEQRKGEYERLKAGGKGVMPEVLEKEFGKKNDKAEVGKTDKEQPPEEKEKPTGKENGLADSNQFSKKRK